MGEQLSRDAVNRAFWELGLRFQWDEATWTMLAAAPDMRTALRTYLEESQPHLLAVYDPATLGALVEQCLANPGTHRIGMEALSSAT